VAQLAGDERLADGREVVLVVLGEELVPPVGEERHVGVHPGAVLAEERLRHEGRVDAVLGGDFLHDQPVRDRVVGHLQCARVAHVDLVLRGPDLVVVVLDRDPDRLERLDRLVPELGGRVHRGHREVAALVERLRAFVVLEEEVLELGADVEGVEAHLPHPVERTAEHVARVALVRLAVGGDDVADHPADLRAAVRQELERGRVGDRDHVRLLDRVEAGDRRAVEAHPVVERALDLGGGDREALQVPLEVGEPEQHVLDALALHAFHHRPPGLGVRGRAVPALHLRHALLLKDKSPGSPSRRPRGIVAVVTGR
jgi:hypothetical protein